MLNQLTQVYHREKGGEVPARSGRAQGTRALGGARKELGGFVAL